MRYVADDLVSEAGLVCPECGDDCHQGVRGRGILIAMCPHHGAFVISKTDREDVGGGWMNCEERTWLIEKSLERFMVDPDADDFMAVQSTTLMCNQLLFRFGDGRFWLEVGSREWDCPICGNRPLCAEALDALADLGFRRLPGGPNPTRFDLPRDRRALAQLADDAMLRAYGEPADFEVAVYFKRTAVLSDVLVLIGCPSP